MMPGMLVLSGRVKLLCVGCPSLTCTLKLNTLFIGLFASARKTSGPPSSRLTGNILPRACGKLSFGPQLCTPSQPVEVLYYNAL